MTKQKARRTSTTKVVVGVVAGYLGSTIATRYAESKLNPPYNQKDVGARKGFTFIETVIKGFFVQQAIFMPTKSYKVYERNHPVRTEQPISAFERSIYGGILISTVADLYYKYNHDWYAPDYKLFGISVLSNDNTNDNIDNWVSLTEQQIQEINNKLR